MSETSRTEEAVILEMDIAKLKGLYHRMFIYGLSIIVLIILGYLHYAWQANPFFLLFIFIAYASLTMYKIIRFYSSSQILYYRITNRRITFRERRGFQVYDEQIDLKHIEDVTVVVPVHEAILKKGGGDLVIQSPKDLTHPMLKLEKVPRIINIRDQLMDAVEDAQRVANQIQLRDVALEAEE